ncbi:hypothetical protein [Parapedomonas caeni]
MRFANSIAQPGLTRVAGKLLKDIGAVDRDSARVALAGRLGAYAMTANAIETALDRHFPRV